MCSLVRYVRSTLDSVGVGVGVGVVVRAGRFVLAVGHVNGYGVPFGC